MTNPVLTTIAIDNIETDDAALDDVSDEEPSTEDDSTVEAVTDIVVSPSAFASPNVYGGRSAARGEQVQSQNLAELKLGRLHFLRLCSGWQKFKMPMAHGGKYLSRD